LKKVLWLDTETSGLDSKVNGIIEVSFIVEVDDVIIEYETFKMKTKMQIDDAALKVNGLTREEIDSYGTEEEAVKNIQEMFQRYINKYNKTDKFIPGGFHVDFDLDFLDELFKRNGDKYMYSYINSRSRIDPQKSLGLFEYGGLVKLTGYNLSSVCEAFGVELTDAHSSMADIRATREIALKMLGKLRAKVD
jgi:DNA polymerase III subunit epsilon